MMCVPFGDDVLDGRKDASGPIFRALFVRL